jgi:hypothetical protein
MAVAAVAAFAFGLPAAAQASPDDTGGQCTWEPVTPSVVTVSNTQMVTASYKLGSCTIYGNPNLRTVCLAYEGENVAPTCAQGNSPFGLQVYLPYRPGATYVMTARGCVTIYEAPHRLCQTYGPVNYTL